MRKGTYLLGHPHFLTCFTVHTGMQLTLEHILFFLLQSQ